MPDRPNMLFLMSDEHRADVVGYEGDAVIRTPVLDELAATGVVFRNASYAPPSVRLPGEEGGARLRVMAFSGSGSRWVQILLA